MARILSDWLDAWMYLCERKEPPTLYKRWMGLFTLAAALERKCWFNWDKTIFPNLYILFVGDSSVRKGSAMYPGLEILMPLVLERRISLASDAGSMQALFDELCETAVEVKHYPPAFNTTQMSSLSAVAEEFSTMMGTNNTEYCNALTALYDCAHPKGVWKYRTKTSGSAYVHGPWFNLIGAITPEMLPKIFPPEVIAGGLASRFMYVYADRRSKTDYCPIETPAEAALKEQLKADLGVINKLQGEFTPTEDWVLGYTEWRMEGDKNPPLRDHQFASYLGRRPTHLIKICMALSASRNDSMVVDREILDRGIKILDATERKMPRVYEGHGTTQWAQYIPALIRLLKRDGSVPISAVSAQFYKDIRSHDQRQMLVQLQNRGVVKLFVNEDGKQWVRLADPLEPPPKVRATVQEKEN